MSAALRTIASPLPVAADRVIGPLVVPAVTVRVDDGPAAGASSTRSPAVTLTVVGDLDVDGAASLRTAWDEVLGLAPRCVLLDLGHVDFCNAAGLRVLAHITESSDGGEVELTLLTGERLDWLLRLVGLVRGLPQHTADTARSRRR